MRILHVVALIQASTGGPAVSVTRLASEQARILRERKAEGGERRAENGNRKVDEVVIACLDYPHLGPQVEAPGVRVVSVKGSVLAVRGRGWCPEFRRVVMEEAARADIVHNHGLWMWPNAYAREAAVAAGKPLVISPRGMLEAWSLKRSRLRKAVAWWLFERRNLRSAAMFHATAESEAESIRGTKGLRDEGTKGLREDGRTDRGRNGCDNAQDDSKPTDFTLKTTAGVPIVVAPNGVDLPDLGRRPGREVLEKEFPQLKDRRWVVFMSRLHPKKGIDVLLRAWHAQQRTKGPKDQGPKGHGIQYGQATEWGMRRRTGARRKEVTSGGWRVASEEAFGPLVPSTLGPVLVLAGPDLIGYRKEVEKMVKALGLEDSVVLTGEVRGEMKNALLANADVFVLPSFSENFGIVVAEAMAWGRPVIASTGMPWKEVADVGAGWWVKPEEGPLTKALDEALGGSAAELNVMGARGRALVADRYGWSIPAAKLIDAYGEVLAAN